MELKRTNELIEYISKHDSRQKKYLAEWPASNSEKKELEEIISFLMEKRSFSIEQIADSYIYLNKMVMEETYYFLKNNRYRNSSFEEVEAFVYGNREYMEKYMTGLVVSDYIWINHLKIVRFFKNNIHLFSGERYLEIGPGFGQYLIKIIRQNSHRFYYAIDLSDTSVEGCNQFLDYSKLSEWCHVQKKDFFEYDPSQKFSTILMGEVLEHVEQPLKMLKKIYELLEDSGRAFITTVINAPAIDHIYLWRTADEILSMATKAGFNVEKYLCSTEGDVDLERAEKHRRAINIAMILRK